MIFTQFIKQLQRLDEMEIKIYLDGPNPPITFQNEQTEYLKNIYEQQKHIIVAMARALNMNIRLAEQE